MSEQPSSLRHKIKLTPRVLSPTCCALIPSSANRWCSWTWRESIFFLCLKWMSMRIMPSTMKVPMRGRPTNKSRSRLRGTDAVSVKKENIENTRWVSFYIKFTRQGFENACWHREACWAIQHAISKASLVNLIQRSRTWYIYFYTTLTNFSTKYLVMCKVYTDVGGIN